MNAPTPALVARPERLRLVGQRRQILALMHQRLMLGMLVYAGVIVIIALRLMYLAAFGDHAGRKTRLVDLTPERGDIVDRDGQTLARTIDAWTVGLQPAKVIGNKLDLARKLAELMPEKDEAAYLEMLRSGRNFFYLRRRASPNLVAAINALGEPGLALEREPDRLYPQLSLAAHVVGFTDIDGKGNAGIERAFDEQLRDPARRDKPIVLSISSRVQQALEHELLEAKTRFSAIGAAGIILDIHTGEVLAMTSLPQLNPNAAGRGTPEQRFNRATLGVYELGSTFKPFTVAMAMDAGIIKSMGQIYPCPESLRVGNRSISDTHPFRRPCSVAEIMKESSNIGTAQIADQLGSERQRDFLDKMGFLDRVQIETLERGRTLSPGSNWNQVARMTVGYGHGIAVTPLHLAIGYATLFNGGIYRPATLLKVNKDRPSARGHRVFSEDTSYKMRSLLRLVVTHGTGKKANAIGYRVGGKTGTANKPVAGGYSNTRVVTSFAGVFPMDEPRYAMVVMLDEPQPTAETFGFRTAGWNAAPVMGKTVSRIAPMLGVRPDKQREPNMSEVLPFVRLKD
ncbi:peptidoglycan D,D-transpeptidase FtsI family protein [Sphingomonas xanthus]|uniref:Penicillin-binding protein 2 n=1 Tax=Sphingomonas xanthus TaxID=2594473 RepID=A0A516IQH2_9SPHN|nr:penicillin-binding protein 2 [Sphingomonas xanthus]QDP19162.1 penicillin-binding protein 2 [Sphingomonas xanthus]